MENFKEEFKVKSEEIIEKVKELIHEGNVRRLIIKDEDGKVYLEIPVTFGVIGAIFAPVLAAVGAVAAMVANLKIEVIREEDPGNTQTKNKTD
jgi:phage-related minor tail protein